MVTLWYHCNEQNVETLTSIFCYVHPNLKKELANVLNILPIEGLFNSSYRTRLR